MSNFPSSLDSFVNPTTNDFLNSPNHVSQHSDINDAVEALEAKLGISASTPTSGKLLRGTGAGSSAWDKDAPTGTIVGTTDTQTLTNKTLTSPTINTAIINNPTLATDTIAEYTSAAGVTVDGLLIKDSKLATNNSVVTANITDDAVTDDKLDYPRWYQEIGRTTLGSANAKMTVSSLPARNYLRLIIVAIASGGAVPLVQVRLNNDSANNYSRRTSTDGAADATATSSSLFLNSTGMASGSIFQGITDIINFAGYPKLGTSLNIADGTTGAATAPASNVTFTKWVNTSNQISRIDVTASANSFATGSAVIVLGHD